MGAPLLSRSSFTIDALISIHSSWNSLVPGAAPGPLPGGRAPAQSGPDLTAAGRVCGGSGAGSGLLRDGAAAGGRGFALPPSPALPHPPRLPLASPPLL